VVSQPRKLFVEGGGDNDALKSECRKAFAALLEKAGFKGYMPRIVACGGRRNAFDQFCTAIRSGENLAILLVDSEASVAEQDPWQHVAQRPGDRWEQPDGASADHLHLMVQCMEAWFLADRRALKDFYGQGFNERALPSAPCEQVARPDLYHSLEQATRDTKTKGSYGKGEHSFKLLERLDPRLVRKASPWAERFFSTLDRLLR
jgi:hypothetical protein